MRRELNRLQRVVAASLGGAVLALAAGGSASAALVYAGSWRIADGPADFTPSSAQSIAALLFGGAASNYVVSKDFAAPESRQAWYFGPTRPASLVIAADDVADGLSAYWGEEFFVTFPNSGDFVNYAFRQVADGGVPEPATWALMICGFGLAGATLRRRLVSA